MVRSSAPAECVTSARGREKSNPGDWPAGWQGLSVASPQRTRRRLATSDAVTQPDSEIVPKHEENPLGANWDATVMPPQDILDPSGATHWTVQRQDDNGNRFIVATGLTREQAEQLAASFEARGHKQLYWVELNQSQGDTGTGAD